MNKKPINIQRQLEKHAASTRKKLKYIKQMIEQHDKVLVIFQDTYVNSNGVTEFRNSFRRRIIRKNGRCHVSYKSDGYDNWSSYGQSCFTDGGTMSDYKQTMSRMKNHDITWTTPIELYYGWFFRNKVTL